jgi:hypothetical protein
MNHQNRLFTTLAALLLTAGFAASSPAAERSEQQLQQQYPNRGVFGINLSSPSDHNPQFPFVNLIKQARPWQTSPGQHPREVMDADGNLTAMPDEGEPYLTTILGDKHPAGRYILTWDGTGKFSIPRYDATEILKEEPNRLEFQVKPEQGIYVRAVEIDPQDPPRNLRLVHESMVDAPTSFNPEFLEMVEPFGVLRFMDWMHTNGSDQEKWENRPRPEMLTWRMDHAHGVPVEVMCELANVLKADAWFCMPHLADDNYVREFAKIVKDKLDPDRKIYIEYSNEVWNWNFEQSRYAVEKGKEVLGVEEGQAPHRAWVAHRSGEMFAIWEEVFGGTERFIRVNPAHGANPRIARQTLEFQDAHQHFDAIAIAPYFGFNKELAGRFKADEASIEEILDAAETVITEKVSEMTREHKALADQYGMELIAYEAGQHLLDRAGRRQSGETELSKRFIEANRTPRMGELYELYIDTWFENGGGVLGMFASVSTPSKWGSWGLKEYLTQPIEDAPKYQATLKAIKNPDLPVASAGE